MNSSVFAGAFALFLLFWLATASGNWPAAVFVVGSALASWGVNIAQDVGAGKAALLCGLIAVISGGIAFASVAVRVLG